MKSSPPKASPADEAAVGIYVDELKSLLLLNEIKGFGPQKFKELHLANIDPVEVLQDPRRLPTKGKTGDTLRAALTRLSADSHAKCSQRASQQIATAARANAMILTYRSLDYPKLVLNSNNPVPVLYVRGSVKPLREPLSVACVGSRKIAEPYIYLQREFCLAALQKRFTITSGFALGADSVGHKTVAEYSGFTICVMPCGLDRPFPPENKLLWDQLLESGRAAFISEFPFGMRASSLTLRKRNKLIVACSRGVLLSQSSVTGGAMNAYRFAREQKKPIATFQGDLSNDDTSGNEMIRKELQPKDRVFPTMPAPAAYHEWLSLLSSST